MGRIIFENGSERTVSEDLKIPLIDIITQSYLEDPITEALRQLNCQSLFYSRGMDGRQAAVIEEYLKLRNRGSISLDSFSENDLSILLTVIKMMEEKLNPHR